MHEFFSKLIERHGALLLVALGLLVLLPGTFSIPVLDRDEPRFSQATAEMMERGEWIIPYFNGEYRFDKPPLTYWWMRVHYWVLGKSEIGARLHSVFSSLLIAVGLFHVGRRHFNTQTGFLSGVIWLTCFQIFQHGRLALADMPMIAAVFYASWALYELIQSNPEKKPRWMWFWMLYAALGLGFLAKGPIAVLTPLLTLFFFRVVFWRKPLHWGSLRPLRGLSFTLAIIALWGIPALLATRGLFWEVGMGEHVIDRGVEAFHGRWIIPGYYFLTVFISLFPWIAFMGFRLEHLKKDWNETSAFLVSWAAGPYLIFLFYSTQLPHYTLPAFPAIILWMASAITRNDWEWKRLSKLWFWIYVALWEVLLIAGLVFVLGSGLPQPTLVWGMACLLFCFLCLNSLVVAFKFRAYSVAVVLLLCIAVCQIFLGSAMRKLSTSIPIARMVEHLADGSRLVGVGYYEPSLVFYTGRKWDFSVDVHELEEELRSGRGRETLYVVLENELIVDQWLAQGWGGAPARPRREIELNVQKLASGSHVIIPVEGLNFARMRWSRILVLFPMDLGQWE